MRSLAVFLVCLFAAQAHADSASTGVLGRPGSYALLPTENVHQFTCSSACTAFVTSDAAFDIHYVDASGKEIPAEAALMKKK